MAQFFPYTNGRKELIGVTKHFSRGRCEVSMKLYKKEVYVHISDIRQCYGASQFDFNKKETASFNYNFLEDLRGILADLPHYHALMTQSPMETEGEENLPQYKLKVCVNFHI